MAIFGLVSLGHEACRDGRGTLYNHNLEPIRKYHDTDFLGERKVLLLNAGIDISNPSV